MIDHKDGDRQLINGAALDLGNGSGSIAVENSGPVSVTLVGDLGGFPPTRHASRSIRDWTVSTSRAASTQNFGGEVSYALDLQP